MDQPLPQSEQRGSIKSLTLQDLVNMRPPFFGRMREIAKTALMIWGAVSLSAAAGYAALQIQGGPEEPVLRNDRPAIEGAERVRAVASVSAPAKPEVLTPAVPVEAELARLPRPRPDEPMITGSIAQLSDPAARRYAQNRHADPCDAWNSLGLPFRLRCVHESQAAPSYQPDYRYRW